MEEVKVFVDGTSKGNPGKASYGFLIYDKYGKILKKNGGRIGITTNNVAEYIALIMGVIGCLEFKPKRLKIYSDSQLLVKQMKGEFKIKDEWLKRLYLIVSKLLESFEKFEIYHISREENKEADKIANSFIENNLF
ncbi:MAG: ribonuclease H [Candidatus Omnitrophota bacterium]|nr:MAG: ribonuclease H [Candidatus Omnitrophota bacterium]HDN97706.1 ribonuclease HI family protein [bacterium]